MIEIIAAAIITGVIILAAILYNRRSEDVKDVLSSLKEKLAKGKEKVEEPLRGRKLYETTIEELIEKETEELKLKVLDEKERAKRLEEAYDELRTEYEKLKSMVKEKDEEIKKKDEKIKKIEEESKKLVRIADKRYKKGHRIPAILWTKRGNALPYKFVVEIAWVNGGYRALLVDSPVAKPDSGEWFPPLDKPAPQFCFKDDPGFNPNDPSHIVLFDVNRHDWEEDLKVTQRDPISRPVALVFGIDEDGNPIHRTYMGSAISIQQLRGENRSLKLEIFRLRHINTEMENKIKELEYRLTMEKDLREHLEKEVQILRSQLFEMRNITTLMGDELEAAREAFRVQKLRKAAALRRAEEAEKLFDAYFGRTKAGITPLAELLEEKSKEKDAKIVALLAPIARREAKAYGIDKTGMSDEEIVDEWIKKKVKEEGMKGWLDLLQTLGIDMDIRNIIREGMV